MATKSPIEIVMSPSRFSLLHSSKFLELSRICFAFSKSFRARASWNSLSDVFWNFGAISDGLAARFEMFCNLFALLLRLPLPMT